MPGRPSDGLTSSCEPSPRLSCQTTSQRVAGVGASRQPGQVISYADLSDRAAVEWAMTEFDRLGRAAFLKKYGYGEAREYFLVTDTGRYDSKAKSLGATLVA